MPLFVISSDCNNFYTLILNSMFFIVTVGTSEIQRVGNVFLQVFRMHQKLTPQLLHERLI